MGVDRKSEESWRMFFGGWINEALQRLGIQVNQVEEISSFEKYSSWL